ncbi:MAG: hypothetical protein V3T17_10640 [Pseudomonadales bacterium]
MRDRPPTPPATLSRARQIAINNGITMPTPVMCMHSAGGSRYCHHCQNLLIERDWYQLGQCGLSDSGLCLHCGEAFPGIYEGPPEHWGARRLNVVMQ